MKDRTSLTRANVANRYFEGLRVNVWCLQYSRWCIHLAFQALPIWSRPIINQRVTGIPNRNRKVESLVPNVVFHHLELTAETTWNWRQYCNTHLWYLQLQARQLDGSRLCWTTVDKDVDIRLRLNWQDSERPLCGRCTPVDLFSALSIVVQILTRFTRGPRTGGYLP